MATEVSRVNRWGQVGRGWVVSGSSSCLELGWVEGVQALWLGDEDSTAEDISVTVD